MQTGHADRGCRSVEGTAERGDPQWLPVADTAEDEFIELPALGVLGELDAQEPWDRNLAALVRLRRSPHESLALDRCHRLGNHGALAMQVEPGNPQCRHLAEPHPGVGEEEHDAAVRLVRTGVQAAVLAGVRGIAALVRQILNLLMGQVAVLRLLMAWEVDALGDVAGESTVLDRHVEDERQDTVHLGHGGGCVIHGERGDPLLHLGVGHITQAGLRPLGQDLLAEDAGVALVGGRLEMRLPVEPSRCPLTHRHLGKHGIDV
nr:hypothetical protein [Nocardioides panacisoli]